MGWSRVKCGRANWSGTDGPENLRPAPGRSEAEDVPRLPAPVLFHQARSDPLHVVPQRIEVTAPNLFNDEAESDEMPLAAATDLFLRRWVPCVQREAARKELDELIDLACRVEPPA